MSNNEHISNDLPSCVTDYINLVIKKMRYSRKARKVVRQELTDHFTDALADCKNQQVQHETAENLIAEFGNAKVLAKLIRRGKKRCRPLWKKMLSYTVRAFLLFIALRVGALGIGTPGANVDYTDWITKQSSQDRPESQNAKPYYDKAGELMENHQWPKILMDSLGKWPGKMSQEEREATVKFVKANEKALDMLKQGTMKPYYWVDYAAARKLSTTDITREMASTEKLITPQFIAEIVDGIMPILSNNKDLVKRMSLRIYIKAYEGDLQGSFDDCIALFKFGCHVQSNGLLLEQLVGVSLECVGRKSIYDILSNVEIQSDILTNIQTELENLFVNHDKIITLKTERAALYDYVQQTFTDDGKGGGRMLIRGLPVAVGSGQAALQGFFLLGFPNKSEVVETIDEFYDRVEKSYESTPFEFLSIKEEFLKERERLVKNNLFLQVLGSAFDKAGAQSWRIKSSRAGVITVLALLRYGKEHGEYPADLADLVAKGYLKELPRDPYGQGPLKYKQEGKDFLLYCLGEDFDDDGGLQSKWGSEKTGGDRVFWPVNTTATESP